MKENEFKTINKLNTAEKFAEYIKELGIDLKFCPEMPLKEEMALRKPIRYKDKTIGNRWAVLAMEGWDCNSDGSPSELTERRWLRFALSGAKLIFGCEATAVMHSGKSSPRQMMMTEETVGKIAALRQEMVDVHKEKFGTADDLLIGLQLNHSGRYSHPNDASKLESVIAYHHPFLDIKYNNQNTDVVTDEEIEDIIRHFIKAAKLVKQAGFDFVDIKNAHGYFGHELLSAYDRPGKYGGSFENRTRFFRDIVEGIKREVPDLDISTRLSLFDFIPFMKDEDEKGIPMDNSGNYKYAFGGDGTGLGYDLTETIEFIKMLKDYGIEMICTTVGSPYYNPHIQRPAAFPVADGYSMPEDPLVGVARQINCVAEIKNIFPEILFVGSGYSYLQDWLPNVGEYCVEHEMVDFVGLGRMVLSYPDMCADVNEGKPLVRKKICRTIGDCTNAPRNGMVSGCYPLDEFYKKRKEFQKLKELKKKQK